jgi:hypothetical protein
MCPKDELISAFLDGEVEAPWEEKLKAHFAECGRCGRRLADMCSLRSMLARDKEPDYRPAMQSVQRRLYFHRAAAEADTRSGTERELPFWKRKVRIPMPAAALLSLVLFILFASFFFFMGQNNTQMAKRGTELYNSQPVQVTVPINGMKVDDLEVLLKLLNNKDFSQEVLMQLPDDSQFSVFGEPEIEKVNKER